MKKSLSLKGFGLLLGCSFLAACNDKEIAENAIKELVGKREACAVDIQKTEIGSIFGRDWLYEKVSQVRKNNKLFTEALKKQKMAISVGYADEIKETCRLTENARYFNPGVVSVLSILQFVVINAQNGHPKTKIDRIEILLTDKSSHPLYAMNDAAKAFTNQKGERIVRYYANAGDYENGLSIMAIDSVFYERSGI